MSSLFLVPMNLELLPGLRRYRITRHFSACNHAVWRRFYYSLLELNKLKMFRQQMVQGDEFRLVRMSCVFGRCTYSLKKMVGDVFVEEIFELKLIKIARIQWCNLARMQKDFICSSHRKLAFLWITLAIGEADCSITVGGGGRLMIIFEL